MTRGTSGDAPPIDYAFEQRPADGELMQVAEGVYWLRMPLPFVLNHINLWVLEDGPGRVLVDTGIASPEVREVWQHVLAGLEPDKPVTKLIVTHLHPDHIGLAGWLCDSLNVPLLMTREEYLAARMLAADHPPPPEVALDFYAQAGLTPDQLAMYGKRFGRYGNLLSDLPESYYRIKDGDRLTINGRRWEVVVGRGHSPEHACLFCPDLNVLIAGDQALPTISPNVSVWPTEPAADPLEEWLASCAELPGRVPEDTLVLPSHGRPFHGLRRRLTTITQEHEAGLQKVIALCKEPQRVVDVFPALFRGRITDTNLIMATGESMAHLNYLERRGALQVTRDASGVRWYRAS